ncbi:hypothetical protein CSC02_3950 [Enterobacter hormaechei subsp. hoffmannii]|nr:hypothetical protein CSC02_3950 [Enterobacter hormaechei subsp. hoffmannii]
MGDGAQKSPAGAGPCAVCERCRVAAAPNPTYSFGGFVNCLTPACR